MASRKSINDRSHVNQDWGVKAYLSDGDDYATMMSTPTEAGVFPRFQDQPLSESKEAYGNDKEGFPSMEDNYAVPNIPEFSWPPQPTDPRFRGKPPALRFTGFAWMYCDGQLGTSEWCPGDIIDFLFDEYFTDPIVRVEIDGPAAFKSGHFAPSATTPDSAKTGTDRKGQHRPDAGGSVPTPYKIQVKADTAPPVDAKKITVNCYTRSGWKCSATANRKDICGGCGSAEVGWAGIHYTTQQMACGASQTLTVLNPEPGTTYKWECTTGSLTPATGDTTTYTAPATNPGCANNARVSVKANGNVCDYIDIAVNAVSGVAGIFVEPPGGSGCNWSIYKQTFNCDGTLNAGSRAGCDSCDCSGGIGDCNCGGGFYCLSPNLVVRCTAASACGTPSCATDYYDTRTPAQIAAGCCPEALL